MALVNINTEDESTIVNDNEIIESETDFSDNNTSIAVPSFYLASNIIEPTTGGITGIDNTCLVTCQCLSQAVQGCTQTGACTSQSEAIDCSDQSEALPAPTYSLSKPLGLALDSNENLYIADNTQHVVFKMDKNLAYISKFGVSNTIKNDNTGLFSPRDCCVDSNGDVYITDGSNQRLVKLNSNMEYVSQFGVTGVLKSDNTGLDNPAGCCADINNNIYVSDTRNSRLVKLNANLEFIGQFGITGSPLSDNTGLNSPLYCCSDTTGNVYVVDNGRVVKIDANLRYITQFDEYKIPTGKSKTMLLVSCCFGTDGNIYIFDNNTHRIIKADTNLNYLTEYLTDATLSYYDAVAGSLIYYIQLSTTNSTISKINYSDFGASVNPCDSSCQDTCEIGCQTTCEAACQCEVQGCQTCQATCQSSCQCSLEGCEACQNFCETGCQCEQEGCQTCQSSCQTACQCLDQSNQCSICESSCQTACESACQCNVQGCQTCQDSCQLNCQTSCQTACQCENQSTQTNLPVLFTWIKTIDNGRTIITNRDLNSIMDSYATIFAYSGLPILEMIKIPSIPNTYWEAKYYNSLVDNVNRLYNYGYVSESLRVKNPGDIINISDMDKLIEIYNTAVTNINKVK